MTIVEIETTEAVRLDTRRTDLSVTEQAKLALLVTPIALRRTLSLGVHDVTPRWSASSWVVDVSESDGVIRRYVNAWVGAGTSPVDGGGELLYTEEIAEPITLVSGACEPIGLPNRRGVISTTRFIVAMGESGKD